MPKLPSAPLTLPRTPPHPSFVWSLVWRPVAAFPVPSLAAARPQPFFDRHQSDGSSCEEHLAEPYRLSVFHLAAPNSSSLSNFEQPQAVPAQPPRGGIFNKHPDPFLWSFPRPARWSHHIPTTPADLVPSQPPRNKDSIWPPTRGRHLCPKLCPSFPAVPRLSPVGDDIFRLCFTTTTTSDQCVSE